MERVVWGPGPDEGRAVVAVELPAMPLRTFLGRVRSLRNAIGVPVQVLSADRVVSRTHVDVAAWHAALAHQDGRARSDDVAVEFLLYVAGDRQIKRAIDTFGFDKDHGGRCLVVALDGVGLAAFVAAVGAAFGVEAAAWMGDADAACDFWAQRLGLSGDASAREVEDGVLAAMAELAVSRL